jgi:xylan 1,4-beta-xylosidase
LHIINGQFRVYFTARDSTGILCIGVAKADKLEGPYTDVGYPLIRQTKVGSIDATILKVPNGTHYLVFKDDGNGN